MIELSLTVIVSWLQKNGVLVSVTLLTVTFIAALITVTDVHTYQNSAIDVWIHIDSVKNNVNRNFLSVAVGSGLLASGKMLNIMQSHDVIRLAKHLSPGYLRIGGNDADLVIFQENGTKEILSSDKSLSDFSFDCSGWDIFQSCSSSRPKHPIVMTGNEWLAINNAARAAELTLLFDLNVLIRTNHGFWNSSNAKELLRFSKENNVSAVWQLGNEPNSFYHKFGIQVLPQQLGNDFNTLKKILQREKFSYEPLLIGPDVTRPIVQSLKQESTSFLKDFLRVAGRAIDAVTWHQYYFNGRTAQLEDFINATHFEVLSKQIREVKEIVASTVVKKIPIWISETSTAYGGGAPGLSNSFVASFLWLDKLGVAARDGVDVVIKQTLIGGYYGLIDVDTLKPLPTWWVSVLYKKLVGTEVLKVYAPLAHPQCRIYGHRSAKSTNDVVLFGVNFIDKECKLKIFHNCTERPYMEKFILTSPGSDLTSSSILLNGKLLNLESDESLPSLHPDTARSDYVTLPPYSLMFTVLKSYNNEC